MDAIGCKPRTHPRRARALLLAVLLCLSAGLGAGAVVTSPAAAQEFPSRPLRLVVGFAPGGGADLIGRTIAALLTDQLGRQVVVDNRGGAGGSLAAELVANAAPDGHTLLLVTLGNALHPHVYKLSYDPAKAFAPVALLGRGGYVLVTTPAVGAADLKALIALAKSQPGQLLMGNSGAGSFVHLAAVLMALTAGVDVTHVAYKGSGPALTELLGGHSQLLIGAPGQVAGHIKSGKLVALGVTDQRRSSLLPDVPTMAEAGLPGYEAANWWALATVAGTPRAAVDKLNRETVAVLASAKAREQFGREGAEVSPLGPEELARFIAAETEKWGRVVRAARIKAE